MSAPQVSALAALILSINNLFPDQVRTILVNSTVKVDQTRHPDTNGRNDYTGYGRIDAYKALKYTLEHYGGTLSQNLTIPVGETWTFQPGVTITFTNGASLIVNNYGTLTANGTSALPITFDFISPNSTTENGIKFIAPTSMGTINYCKIRNAYRGIYEYQTVVNITNSAISGCTDGIYLYSSSPTIQGCNIHNNSDYGISTFWSSANIQTGNYIKYNNNGGIFCSSSSQPIIGNNSTNIGNYISNNSYGVIVFNNANPKIGNGSLGGYNNIDNSTNNILNTTNNTVYAQNNWWNSNPNNLGSVISTPSLPSAVNVPQPPLSKTNGYLASSDDDIPMLSELDNAYQLVASNNLADARTICLNLINNYPDYSVSYNALNLLKETYSRNELTAMKEIYSSLFNKKTKKDLYAMAGLIFSDIDKENKLKQIDEVIDSYKGENVIELALFDKLVYYYFELNDVKNARIISEELDKQFPLSEGAVEAHKILGDEEYYKITPKQNTLQKTTAQTTAQAPGEYALLGNYPNPFNPSTNISYSLPFQSSVELTIYDIMGKEVKSFDITSQSSGYQNIVWEGTNENGNPVSSGIYLYRISIKSLENNETFVKTAKLIMLK